MASRKHDSNGVIIPAKDLRVSNKPGWYRWWAPEKALEQLLNSQYVSKKYYNELKPKMTEKNGRFYIYVGIAVNLPVRNRLDCWHVNQQHKIQYIKHRTLSTLRQSIASLVAGDLSKEEATNDFIDMLYIEYYTSDYPTDSRKAEENLGEIEEYEMDKYVLPLNISGNHRPELKPFISDLKKARAQARSRALEWYT
jgi:hypothetical protein